MEIWSFYQNQDGQGKNLSGGLFSDYASLKTVPRKSKRIAGRAEVRIVRMRPVTQQYVSRKNAKMGHFLTQKTVADNTNKGRIGSSPLLCNIACSVTLVFDSRR